MLRRIKYEWPCSDASGVSTAPHYKFIDGSRYLDPNPRVVNQRETFIKEGGCIYHVVVNRRFPYVGVDLLERGGKGDATRRSVANVFLQGSEQVEELLGENGEDRDPIDIVKRLAEYLDA